MSSSLKYIAIIIVAVTVLVILFKISSCGSGNNAVQSTDVPTDSNFAPVIHKDYQPPSLPGTKKKIDVKLPAGIHEDDVKKIIRLTVHDVPATPSKKIDIIELEDGGIFVQRDLSISSVEVIDVQPALFEFDLRYGVGLSIGKCGNGLRYSPSAVFAPVEWNGFLQLPIVVADLDGVGPGVQAKVYHDIYLGIAQLWRYDVGQQSKIILHYDF